MMLEQLSFQVSIHTNIISTHRLSGNVWWVGKKGGDTKVSMKRMIIRSLFSVPMSLTTISVAEL
jgi:hypothetical protein